jgi:hypothetical protein
MIDEVERAAAPRSRDSDLRWLVRVFLAISLGAIAIIGTPTLWLVSLFPDWQGGHPAVVDTELKSTIFLCALSGITAYALARRRAWARRSVDVLGTAFGLVFLFLFWVEPMASASPKSAASAAMAAAVVLPITAAFYALLRYAIGTSPGTVTRGAGVETGGESQRTVPRTAVGSQFPRRLESAVAVLLGLLAIVVLSGVTNEVLYLLGADPAWDEPNSNPGLILLALSYRIAYTVVGGYIAAKLAPYARMRHAWALGVLELAVGGIRAITTFSGPSWHLVVLALAALPSAWLGGVLQRRRQSDR